VRVRLIVSAALAAAATYSALIREAAPTLNRRSHGDGHGGSPPDEVAPAAIVRVTHVPAAVADAAPATEPTSIFTDAVDAADDPIAALARTIRASRTDERDDRLTDHEASDAIVASRAARRIRGSRAVGDVTADAGPVAVARHEPVTPRADTPTGATGDRIASSAATSRRSPFTARAHRTDDLLLTPVQREPVVTDPEARSTDRPRPASCALVEQPRRDPRPSNRATATAAPTALIGDRPVRRHHRENPAMPVTEPTPVRPLAEGRFSLSAVAANPGDMTLTAVTFEAPVATDLSPDAIALVIDSATNVAPGPFAVTGRYHVAA